MQRVRVQGMLVVAFLAIVSQQDAAATVEATLNPKSPAAAELQKSQRPSWFSRVKASFAKLRPVRNSSIASPHSDWESVRPRSLNEQIFNTEVSQKMADQYNGSVAPLEKELSNPNRRASYDQLRRFEESRKEMANWTFKEIGKHHLKDFVRRRKGNSAALGVVAATSGLEDDKPTLETDKEKVEKNQRTIMTTLPVAEKEESIPTRLRAKLNILKSKGQLTFSNPVATTSVEAQAEGDDKLAVEMNRGFKKLELSSKVRYAVNKSLLSFNLNKKITEEVSLDLNSERWTGSKRSVEGLAKKDAAKLLYSISF